MKERISITLDKEIIKEIDKRVNGEIIKNRSQEIEMILADALGINLPKIALILAGGKGTRLRPLTHKIPKPLLKVQGKPILEHLIDLFKKYNIKNIILSVGYLKEKIKDYFKDGKKFGVNITYIEEEKPLGTAGPLRLAKPLLKESFIVANGDELKDINIPRMYRLHKRKKALATIALTTVDNPSHYGVARLDGTRIIEFLEKPKKPPSNLINAGFYILEPEVIDLIPQGYAMLETDVFPKIAKLNRLRGFPFSGQWFDIGTIEKYKIAIKRWKGTT